MEISSEESCVRRTPSHCHAPGRTPVWFVGAKEARKEAVWDSAEGEIWTTNWPVTSAASGMPRKGSRMMTRQWLIILERLADLQQKDLQNTSWETRGNKKIIQFISTKFYIIQRRRRSPSQCHCEEAPDSPASHGPRKLFDWNGGEEWILDFK